MKLILGTTEIADIPEDVARQLLQLFQSPGHLSAPPQIGAPHAPDKQISRMEGSYLAQAVERDSVSVAIELTVSVERRGPPFTLRNLEGRLSPLPARPVILNTPR